MASETKGAGASDEHSKAPRPSRRQFLQGVASVGATVTTAGVLAAETAAASFQSGQRPRHIVGYLAPGSPAPSAFMTAFVNELQKNDLVVGQGVEVVYKYAGGNAEN